MKVTFKPSKPKAEFYILKAKTYDGVRAEFDRRTHSGCYHANPGHSYKTDADDVVISISMTCSPTIEMPNWPHAKKLKGKEKKNWDSMIKALKKHEAEHHTIYLKDTKVFKAKLKTAGNFPEADFATKMSEFYSSAQTHQEEFDVKTNHGGKTGVKLPPVP